jgi:hypothetical protein
MPFTGIFTPQELGLMSKVLDDHCAECGIERPSTAYQDAGYLIMALYKGGAQTADELKAALNAALNR